jgi:Inner membrane component of T3SS, cytoplasmic domain
MNKLQLFVENQQRNYPLKPDKEYILGSHPDCTLSLPYENVADRHLKFSFDLNNNIWHLTNLNSNYVTFINDRQIDNYPYPIDREMRISMGNSVFLTVKPETNTGHLPTPPAQPSNFSPPQPPIYQSPVVNSPISPNYPGNISRENEQQNFPISGAAPLLKVDWERYIEKQIGKQPNWFLKVVNRFSLVTGFRNTPWIRNFSGYTLQGGNSLGAFEGYIIPDFNESEITVRDLIERQVGQLRQYQNTDCYTTELTDAHIADSSTQRFLGIELFPIIRSNRADWRKLCVVSYNRVRTYLLIENYGSDLFVSWVTRFEPDPTAIGPLLWFILAIVLTLILMPNFMGNIFIFTIPIAIWSIVYLLTPYLMLKLKILPKQSNARLVIFILLVIYIFLVFLINMMMLAAQFRGSY